MPLQKEIQRRGHQVMWFSDKSEGQLALQDVECVFDDIAQVIDYRPDVVLVATNEVPDFITGLKVQIFHGFNAQKRASKKYQFSHFNIRGFFDLYCTQGPSTTLTFQQLAQKHQHFMVKETGWPKMDSLFDLSPKPTEPSGLKTILIASTFTQRLSLAHNQGVFDEIARLIDTNKYKFMMVLHPKMDNNIKRQWQQLADNTSLTYYDTTDLNPLFVQADMMFADTTSAIQEFLLQNKPVITFRHNTQTDYLINIDAVKDLENTFDQVEDRFADIADAVSRFIQQLHPYNDGQSSARVIDASIEMLLADKSHLKSKPWNLLRKFKIRKRLKYFTWRSYRRPHDLDQS